MHKNTFFLNEEGWMFWKINQNIFASVSAIIDKSAIITGNFVYLYIKKIEDINIFF